MDSYGDETYATRPINHWVPEEYSKLSAEDQQGFLDGLRWIWDAAPLGYADWVQCPNLQAAIGKSVTWVDIAQDR